METEERALCESRLILFLSLGGTMQENNSSSTAYDDAYRTMLEKCSSLVLPVINELFGEDYSGEEEVILNQNELFITTPDEKSVERITDSSMQVVTADRKRRYHIECQSTRDQSILIRLFEYDSQIALDYSSLEENCLVVEFPRSALIYLRSNEKTPDEMTIEIRTSDGQSIRHRIPVMKLNRYGMDELFEKKLWFLLPFHGFCYEETFPESETDQNLREKLTGIFQEMRRRLDDLCSSGQMNEYQKYRIISSINMVLQKLMEKYPNARKEVLDVMGGKVVECEADWILQRGIEQGREQGLKQGRSQLIENMLNNKITPEEIAAFCSCEIQEVENVQKKMLVNI